MAEHPTPTSPPSPTSPVASASPVPSAAAMLPFVAAPAGDRAQLEPVAQAAARHWGLPAPILIRVGMNAVYSAGDEVVLRVCRPTAPATAALDLARTLDRASLRVPLPRRDDVFVDGGVSVVAVDRVVPSGDPVDWVDVGRQIRRLHSLPVVSVPPAHPLPRGLDFPWWQIDALLDEVASGPAGGMIDAPALAGMREALARHAPSIARARAGSTVVCHGDVHPGNVIQSADGPVLLDWDLLCREHRGWDHGPLMTWTERWGGAPGLADAFVAGYGEDLREDPISIAFAELRLLAATLMRVRAAVSNEAARGEASLRLAFWRGDADAPMWSAV